MRSFIFSNNDQLYHFDDIFVDPFIKQKKRSSMITNKQKKELLAYYEEFNDEYEKLMQRPILQAEYDEIDIVETKQWLIIQILKILEIDFPKYG